MSAARERMMDKQALPPVGRDLYLLGAEQGFRLGYLAAGEVAAAALGERRWRIRDQLADELRRRFDEVAGRCMAKARGEGPGNF